MFVRLLGILATLALGAQAVAAPVATTKSGSLQGVRKGEVDVFLSVPYAEPPVGSLRWRAPVAVQPWTGVRIATEHAASCYQEWPARTFGPYTSEFVDTPRHAGTACI